MWVGVDRKVSSFTNRISKTSWAEIIVPRLSPDNGREPGHPRSDIAIQSTAIFSLPNVPRSLHNAFLFWSARVE
jgi:hypothetical protein